MRVVKTFAVGSVSLFVIVLVMKFYFSKSVVQIADEYGLNQEQVALYITCNKVTSEGMTRFPPKLDPVDGCACLVSRVNKENYPVYIDIFNSMGRKPVADKSPLSEFSSNDEKRAGVDGASVLAEIRAFTDFAANAEYCVRLN